jgi:hypothetical protein
MVEEEEEEEEGGNIHDDLRKPNTKKLQGHLSSILSYVNGST